MELSNISIIIPTYNRKTELKSVLKCIDSQQTTHIKLHTTVVSDASTDGTIEMLKSDFRHVQIVEGNGSWWFTRCVNEGIKAAEANNPDFILILNDDLEIKADYIQQLFNDSQTQKEACIMGSVTVSIEQPRRIFFSGTHQEKKFPYRWKQYIPILSDIDIKDLNGIYPSKELSGRGSLIPFHVVKELNYFDEHFPQYHSDYDFCLRAAKKGYASFISHNAKMFVHIEKTSDSTSFKKISTRNFIRNLWNIYSRKHIGQNARMIWRHKGRLLFPITFTKWILTLLLNHFKTNLFKA